MDNHSDSVMMNCGPIPKSRTSYSPGLLEGRMNCCPGYERDVGMAIITTKFQSSPKNIFFLLFYYFYYLYFFSFFDNGWGL